MRTLSAALLVATLFAACNKHHEEPPALEQPPTTVVDKQGLILTVNRAVSVDIDQNGTDDFKIMITATGSSGSNKDTHDFLVIPNGQNAVLVDNAAHAPPFSGDDMIVPDYYHDYSWDGMPSAMLAQKVIHDDADFWSGIWVDAGKKFVAVRLKKNGRNYLGWLELKVDKSSTTLLVYRTGCSQIADRAVKAGG